MQPQLLFLAIIYTWTDMRELWHYLGRPYEIPQLQFAWKYVSQLRSDRPIVPYSLQACEYVFESTSVQVGVRVDVALRVPVDIKSRYGKVAAHRSLSDVNVLGDFNHSQQLSYKAGMSINAIQWM